MGKGWHIHWARERERESDRRRERHWNRTWWNRKTTKNVREWVRISTKSQRPKSLVHFVWHISRDYLNQTLTHALVKHSSWLGRNGVLSFEHLLERLCLEIVNIISVLMIAVCNAFNLLFVCELPVRCKLRHSANEREYRVRLFIGNYTQLPHCHSTLRCISAAHTLSHASASNIRRIFNIIYACRMQAHYCFFYIVKRHKKRKLTPLNGMRVSDEWGKKRWQKS